jgi:hypothetical protein
MLIIYNHIRNLLLNSDEAAENNQENINMYDFNSHWGRTRLNDKENTLSYLK